jgi:hypothetical protein
LATEADENCDRATRPASAAVERVTLFAAVRWVALFSKERHFLVLAGLAEVRVKMEWREISTEPVGPMAGFGCTRKGLPVFPECTGGD